MLYSLLAPILIVCTNHFKEKTKQMDFSTFFYGMGVSLSLIVAIGAQNAFVLKQGIKRQFVFLVCAICATSDALLITAGVFGLGTLIGRHPLVVHGAKIFGAMFLFWYGFNSLKSALKESNALIAQGKETNSLAKTAALTLGFTWLNPHVYLDTVVLIGSISAKFANKTAFALGAMSASFGFFFALGFGARLLEPVFKNPKSWQVLDCVIGLMMWGLGLSLLLT